MKFGVLYEHQMAKPWQEGDEHELFEDALDPIELADRLGFDCVWEVEHPFLEKYSHSSAPEVFLAAASQRTKRIRLGHGIVAPPHPYDHPFRVAERFAREVMPEFQDRDEAQRARKLERLALALDRARARRAPARRAPEDYSFRAALRV